MSTPVYIKHNIVMVFILLLSGSNAVLANKALQLKVVQPKTEYFTNPVGIGEINPRFSWIIESPNHNTIQTALQIQVAHSQDGFDKGGAIWDTEIVESQNSVHFRYEGPRLESRKRYYWRVRVWDNHNNVSPWSEISYWEMGLLDADNWQVSWIEPDLEEDINRSEPSPMLRDEFNLSRDIVSARAYVTSHGLYELFINGKRVGEDLFTPGWTSYNNRLQYQTYDITNHLQRGGNAIGAFLGDGWYRGFMGWGDQRNYYGEKLALLVQIEITYEDGSTEITGTGKNWKSSTGPVLRSDIYNGEVYDARGEKEGWTLPGYNDTGWSGVILNNSIGKDKLIAQEAPPVRRIQELKPVDIFYTPGGDLVVDMGQNMIGWIRLSVKGEPGTVVTLRHAEVLDRYGNFYTDNLRSADQTNKYILKGGGIETWEPKFTFQGFRYLAVDGYPGELSPDAITGIVIHSDMEPTGHFQSSNALVNQLQHNIVWGQKGNFLDVPTDCPQRDERMGWTGDIQVFANTANINMNTGSFLTKWLGDLEADQDEAGNVPHVVPHVLSPNNFGSAGWGDAAVIVPWSMYRYFGDTGILEKQYESMKGWVEYIRNRAASNEKRYLWNSDHSYGDWLSFSTASNAHYPGAYTDFHMIATMYFAHSADIMRRVAAVLGKVDDVIEYTTLFENVKAAFQKEYLTPAGRIMSDTQTTYLLALEFGLIPEDLIPVATQRLVTDVRNRGHLTTGFLGTPKLNPVLSRYGYNETAYNLLLRESFPSWLYPVTMGATTIWERWDGIKPDGTFQSEGMNSFNHYAYGAIGEWLFEYVAGIKPAAPGYSEIEIRPTPGGGLTHAQASVNSVYGRIGSSWEFIEDDFVLNIEIPANTTAKVVLPFADTENISESVSGLPGILSIEQNEYDVTVTLGSGTYTFNYRSTELMETAQVEGDKPLPLFRPDFTIGELLSHRESREILSHYLPELAKSPWLSQVMGFTIEQASPALPAKYRISDSVADSIFNALSELNM